MYHTATIKSRVIDGGHAELREFTEGANLPQQVFNELAMFRRSPLSFVVGDVLGPLGKPDERLETCYREVEFSPLCEL